MNKKIGGVAAAIALMTTAFLAPSAANASTADSAPASTITAPASTITAPPTVATAAVPSTAATGGYEYICQIPDGTSWSLASGEPTSDCHGSYLQRYINGTMVDNISLAYNPGDLNDPPYSMSGACAMIYYQAAVLVFFLPEDAWAWVGAGVSEVPTIAVCAAS